MFLHYLLYIISFGLVLSYNIFDNGYIPFILDVIFIILSLFSLFTLFILRKNISVDYTTENVISERGEKSKVCVCVENKSRVPMHFCKIIAIKKSKSGGNKKIRMNVYCNPRNEQEICFETKSDNCENYEILIRKVYIYDAFQLLVFSKKVNKTANVLVMPKLPEYESLSKMLNDISDESEFLYSQSKPGNDPTEIFALREYAPGDKIRNIHWKLTSKVNQVMVKQYGLPITDKDTIVLDIDNNENSGKLIRNSLYDLLYGLIYVMTSRGCGLSVCFVNYEYKTARIENENDIHKFFAELYDAKRDLENSCAELYYANHNKIKNRVFYVTDYYNDLTVNRMKLLEETGPVYYLIPKMTGGGEFVVKFEQ